MPPVVAAVVAAGVSYYFGAVILTVAVVALSAYSVATVLQLKIPAFPTYTQQIKDRKIMLRSSNQTRSIVYGEVKVSGPLVFAAVSGDDNEYLHLVIPLASHEVNQIGDVYFNDKLSTFYDDFSVAHQSKIYYKENGSAYKATVNGTAYEEATAEALRVTLNALADITATLEILSRSGDDIQKLLLAGDSASKVITITATSYITSDSFLQTAKVELVNTRYEPYRISKHLGSSTQAADSDLVSEVEQWTSAHRLRGIAYVYVRLWWKQDVWMTGIPNIAAVVQGKKVLDYRDDTTGYTNNWALCLADYLRDSDGFGASAAEVDTASIITAANASDEKVALTSGEQKRYTLDGMVRLDVSPRKNLDGMLGAGVGSVVYTQGVFKLFAGVYTAPVKTLTIDDLAGPIKLRAKASRADSFNAVKGTFADPEQEWEPSDFPIVVNSTYQTEDNEERIFADIELGFTTNSTRAQRIGKIVLEKSRQGITLDFPCNMSALELAVNDIVRIDVDQLGWGFDSDSELLLESGDTLLLESGDKLLMELAGGKQFKIVQWNLSSKGGVDLRLAEEASGVYDWNKGDETDFDLAPNTLLPDPFTVAVPTDLVLVSADNNLIHEDGTITERIKATWVAAVSDSISRYEIQFKSADETVWQLAGFVEFGQTLEFYISPVVKDEIYDVRVRTESSIGVRSAWLELLGHIVAASTNVTISILALSNWTNRDPIIGNNLSGVAHNGSDLWVVTSFNAGVIATSPDGITWTSRSSLPVFTSRGVAHNGSGLWIVVGADSSGDSELVTSPDGITWTSRTTSFGASDIMGVAYNGSNLWVVVGEDGKLETSPDGTTWTSRTSSFGVSLIRAVAYDGSGLWVAVSDGGKLATSPDGITWTQRTLGLGSGLTFGVAHDGDGLWVVVGNDGGSGVLATSLDGITWVSRTSGLPVSGALHAITHGGSGVWVAVGNGSLLMYSTDGIIWNSSPTGLGAQNLNSITYNGSGLWVAVGSTNKLGTSLFTN